MPSEFSLLRDLGVTVPRAQLKPPPRAKSSAGEYRIVTPCLRPPSASGHIEPRAVAFSDMATTPARHSGPVAAAGTPSFGGADNARPPYQATPSASSATSSATSSGRNHEGRGNAHHQDPHMTSQYTARRSACVSQSREASHFSRTDAHGNVTEYVVYDSDVPSNEACNALAAAARHDAERAERLRASAEAERDRRAALEEERRVLDAERQRKAAMQREAQSQLDACVQQRRSRSEERARQDSIEREMYAWEDRFAREEKNESRARDAVYRRELLEAAEQQKAARRQRSAVEREIERQLLDTFRHESDEAVRANRTNAMHARVELERAWSAQASYRHQREVAEKNATAQPGLNTWLECGRDERDLRASNKQKEQALRHECLALVERRKQSEGRQHEKEVAREREHIRQLQEAERADAAASRQKKNEIQHCIRQQILSQVAHRRDAEAFERNAERERERLHREAAVRVDRRVLYRCPVSGKLFPPEGYNMPRQPLQLYRTHF